MKEWIRRHHPSFRQAEESSRDVPGDIWAQCERCRELLYQRELENSLMVCSRCSNHFRVSAPVRVSQLADEGTWEEFGADLQSDDPLCFVSNGESYKDKLAETRRKSGLKEAIMTGTVRIEGCPAVLAVSDFRFMGGSMGSVYGEKLVRAVDVALEQLLPVLTVSSSGGARMHEGVFSLMQMANTTAAFARLGRSRLPHISLLADPCLGGVTASYATSADIILAEPGALVGFAGPRVIEQITRQKLPPGFQTAEFCLEHGMIDMVTPRKELRTVLRDVLALLHGGGRAVAS